MKLTYLNKLQTDNTWRLDNRNCSVIFVVLSLSDIYFNKNILINAFFSKVPKSKIYRINTICCYNTYHIHIDQLILGHDKLN